MKEKILNVILNLFKVKSNITFVVAYVFVYAVKNNQVETATIVAIIMMVFQNLYDKNKTIETKKEDDK